jgi:cell division protein FtsQ
VGIVRICVRRRIRNALMCLLAGGVLLGGGWLLVRNSSLVAVDHVHISGVHGAGAKEIRLVLDEAAKHMTTLNASAATLRHRLAGFAQVSGLHVSTSFPHTIHITVSEQLPVAVLSAGAGHTALAANGVVLGSMFATEKLPVIDSQSTAAGRVENATTLSYLTVLGAAPEALLKYVARAYASPRGITLAMRNGLLVYFGVDTRPHAKWLSLTRVLADPDSAGATYIDVRLPERPAAGIAGEASSSSADVSGLDSNSAALAQTLDSAISASPTQAAATASPTATSTEPTSTETQASETTASSSTETTPTPAATAETTIPPEG